MLHANENMHVTRIIVMRVALWWHLDLYNWFISTYEILSWNSITNN